MKYHTPVLQNEVINYLNPANGKKYIDCTLGDGGHTLALLEKGAIVLGIDINSESSNRAKSRIENAGFNEKFISVTANFKDLDAIAEEFGFTDVNGILFDLGYSSFQLDESNIGLSFQSENSLDMRLEKRLSVTAADLVNKLPQPQLEMIIREYGGEKLAKTFAKKIVEIRELKKIQTTKDLADLLKSVSPSGYERGRIHPATRTFQALRIAVNDELENLKSALPQAARHLLPGGRLIVISFHSLEDKISKSIGQHVQPGIELRALEKKPIVPSESEIKENIRARSAKMRVYERI